MAILYSGQSARLCRNKTACQRVHSATQQCSQCKAGRCKHREDTEQHPGRLCSSRNACEPEELIRTAASMEGPQQTAAQISALPQDTVHAETGKLALLWACGPMGLPHEGQATVLSLPGTECKGCSTPDLHIMERNNNDLHREVTGRFRHGRWRKHACSLGQSLHPRLTEF